MKLRLAIALALFVAIAAGAFAQSADQPMYPENSLTKVSEHVYAVMGFPNAVIVVGNRATLVVDTGLGPRNGEVVMREVEKLGRRRICTSPRRTITPSTPLASRPFRLGRC